MRIRLVYALAVSLPLLIACIGDSSTSGDDTNSSNTQGENLFPTDLAISSPTDVVEEDASPSLADPQTHQSTHLTGLNLGDLFSQVRQWIIPMAIAAPLKVRRYTWATLRINALLNGSTAVRNSFIPELFLVNETNAGCFGPAMAYEDHPDDATPNDGHLPTGDLGIWTETDATTGHACAAAQLTARMRGVSWRSNMALMGLASMLGQMISDGISAPSAGDTVDLTTSMSGLGISNVTFSTASLSLDATGTMWTYLLNFSYIDGSSISHDIELKLQHTPGTSSAQYSGMLTYAVGNTFNGGNCPGADPKDVTLIGTLKYTRDGLTDMELIHRSGQYCGHGPSSTLASFDSDNLLDPNGKWDGSKGWADNFSRLGAHYDPTSLEGSYLYGWQAGQGDSNTRLFAVGLNTPPSSGQTAKDGEAYFGYGDEISVSDGSINGMFCSWAAPGSSHTLQDYAQRQFIEYNSTSFLWEQPSGGSDILYAPTNDCTYDGSSSFWYDRNLSGTIDEASSDLIVGASGSGLIPLLDLMDSGSDPDIATRIANRGYTKPSF